MKTKVVLVGARGYATAYLEPLLKHAESERYEFVGIVARDITKSPCFQEVQSRGIPVYKTLEAFFNENTADLVIIATPPHLHAAQSLLAIANGANVLCEKPIAPLYTDALAMKAASESSGRFIGIGFQWAFSQAVQSLKKDILSEKFGKPKLFKSFVSWPRGWDYYEGTWKGNVRDPDGTWILDSVVGNATAHYLQVLYFLLGKEMDGCDFPQKVSSELYRANRIDNFDTCLLDIQTCGGANIFYVASHATDINENPRFQLEFENAVITYNMINRDNRIVAIFSDGNVNDYGDPGVDIDNRLWQAIDSVSTGEPLACEVKTALAHTFTVNKLYEHGKIVNFPAELVTRDVTKRQTSVIGLYDLLSRAYQEERMLADMDVAWAEGTTFVVEKGEL